MATILVAIALAVLAGVVLVTLRSALLWLFVSFFVAVVLNPLVEALSRRLGHGLAVTVVVVGALAALAGLALVAVPPFLAQASELVTSAPAAVERFSRSPSVTAFEQRFGLGGLFNNLLRSLPGHLTSAVQPMVSLVSEAVRFGLAVVSIFFLVVFMLFSGPSALRAGLAQLQPATRLRVETAGRKIYWATTRYALGTGFLALLAGVMATVTLRRRGALHCRWAWCWSSWPSSRRGFVTGCLLVTGDG
jgi:predicted PurR-regulated permease PerM